MTATEILNCLWRNWEIRSSLLYQDLKRGPKNCNKAPGRGSATSSWFLKMTNHVSFAGWKGRKGESVRWIIKKGYPDYEIFLFSALKIPRNITWRYLDLLRLENTQACPARVDSYFPERGWVLEPLVTRARPCTIEQKDLQVGKKVSDK